MAASRHVLAARRVDVAASRCHCGIKFLEQACPQTSRPDVRIRPTIKQRLLSMPARLPECVYANRILQNGICANGVYGTFTRRADERFCETRPLRPIMHAAESYGKLIGTQQPALEHRLFQNLHEYQIIVCATARGHCSPQSLEQGKQQWRSSGDSYWCSSVLKIKRRS